MRPHIASQGLFLPPLVPPSKACKQTVTYVPKMKLSRVHVTEIAAQPSPTTPLARLGATATHEGHRFSLCTSLPCS